MGKRFVAWFVRRNYKQLLNTDWGFEFYDWILSKAAGDLQGRSPIVVVEISPDLVKGSGCHVRVFGSMRLQVVVRQVQGKGDSSVVVGFEESTAGERFRGLAQVDAPFLPMGEA